MQAMESSTIGIIIVTVFSAFILLYKYLTKNFGYWESQGVPFVKAYPIIGSEFDIFRKPLHEIDLERCRKHGRIYGTYMFMGRMLNVTNPEIIKSILVKDFPVFVNRQIRRTGIKMFDIGLSFAVNDDWKRIRSVVSPTFSTGKIRKMAFLVENVAKKLTQHFLKAAEKGEVLNIKNETTKFSSEVIAACAFGIRYDPFTNPNHPFIVNSRRVFGGFIVFFLLGVIPQALSFLKDIWGKFSGIGFFTEAAKEIIEQRRNLSSQKNVDFLQLMIDAKDGKLENTEENKDGNNKGKNDEIKSQHAPWTKTLDEDEIVAQCATFLLAGHETVASTISYATYNLARHPDVQEKLLREVDETWEKDGKIDYDSINKMPYLNAVISETLRLQTIAFRIMRQAKEDYIIPNTKILIPKNAVVSIPTYALHHDPEFFPDPEKFDPDRFLPENKDNIIPYTYMPFGDGPRNCIAMRFAQMEVKFCLAYFLRYVKLSPTEETMKPLKLFVGLGGLQSYNAIIVRPEKRRTFDLS